MHQNILLFRIRHMGINFCSADGTVSQHFLDVPHVNILFQKKCSEGVPEHMWGDMLADTSKICIVVNHEPHRLI